MSVQRSVIVIGSGPGIGLSVAKTFASKGYNIALLSRDATRLQNEKEAVENHCTNNIKVQCWSVDVNNKDGLAKTLDSVAKADGFSDVECVYFNCARVGESPFFDFSTEELESDFKTTITALYVTAAWAMPKLLSLAESSPNAHPSLLVTNSMLYKEPVPGLFSLCLTKAAQRNLVQSLAMQFQPKGVHIGLVSVEGQVSPDHPHMSPNHIAGKAWELFSQPKGNWTLEIEIPEKK